MGVAHRNFPARFALALTYATVYALTAQEGLFGTLFSDVWCTAVSRKGEGEKGRKRKKEGGERDRRNGVEIEDAWTDVHLHYYSTDPVGVHVIHCVINLIC